MSRYSVRGVIVSVIAVAAFAAVCAVVLFGGSQSPVYTYRLDSVPAETSGGSGVSQFVYYAEDSQLWHSDKDCPLLAGQQVLYESSVEQAESSGRGPCPECVG